MKSLHRILSDPNFKPPECLLDLNLKGDFKELLESCPKKDHLRFSVNEAKLILPFFEVVYPDDGRPRKALSIVEKWLSNYDDACGAAAYYAARAVIDAARAAAGDASNAAFDIFTAHYITNNTIDNIINNNAAYNAAYNTAHDAASAASIIYAAADAAVYNISINVTDIANWVRENFNITYEDQLRRLFKIMEKAK